MKKTDINVENMSVLIAFLAIGAVVFLASTDQIAAWLARLIGFTH